MRIPSGVTDQYIYFVAVDATDFTSRETGLTTWTVYRSRNGAAAAVMTTPTINETDATNMPGVYELLLDEDMTIDAGDDTQEMVFHITHAGMAPVSRTIELYRPKITAGNTLGVASDGDISGNVDGAVASVTAEVSADVTKISGTATAADALESIFTGAGATDDIDITLRSLSCVNDAGIAFTATGTDQGIKAEATAINGAAIYALGSGQFAYGLHARAFDDSDGARFTGEGLGNGLTCVAGATGNGLDSAGGITSGSALALTNTSGDLITGAFVAGNFGASSLDGKGDWSTATTIGTPAGADIAADIAAVKTDTGNLVTRITSTLFTGITSLAEWLGLMAGAQVANATALTEIKATGAGSGTYDESTDSQEAIAGAGGGGAPTVVQIRQEMDSNSTQLAAIVEDTGTTIPGTITTLQTAVSDVQTGQPAQKYSGVRGPGVYVNTGAANTSTTLGTDGTVDNPVSTLAAAITLTSSLGAKRIYLKGSSTLALTGQTLDGYEFVGLNGADSNTINLGTAASASVLSNVDIFGCTVYGTHDLSDRVSLTRCELTDAPAAEITTLRVFANKCLIISDITVDTSNDNVFVSCANGVPGGTSPVINATGATGTLLIQNWNGPLTLDSLSASHDITITGRGTLTFGSSCNVNAIVKLYGDWQEVDNTAGMATVTREAVFNRAAVNAEADTAISDAALATAALIGTPVNADISADIAAVKGETALIVADTNELQTDDYPTLIAAVQAAVDAVKTVTDLLPSSGALTDLPVNITKVLGTALAETTGGRIAANMNTFWDNADAATAQTVDDVGGGGGGVGNLTQILGTNITETTAGNIAANFDEFFDNDNALTTKVVDDVGAGAGGSATGAKQDEIIALLGQEALVNTNILPGGKIVLKKNDDHTQAASNEITITQPDVGAVIFDLTQVVGTTIQFGFRKKKGGAANDITGTIAVGDVSHAADVTTIIAEVTAAATASATVGEYRYDIQLTTAGGDISTILTGPAVLQQDNAT